jgi:hypothetical protein
LKVDFLLHIFKKGDRPFRSLSALPDAEAVSIMQGLYVKGSVFWERFQDPLGYLSARRRVEQLLFDGFCAKSGRPQQRYPIYLVLGRPRWMARAADPVSIATTDEIQVPLDVLEECDVSFTYPDSMVSALMVAEKNPLYYEPEYHGKVFALKEIAAIVAEKGLPGEGWETRMPSHFAHYIEAQVWNAAALEDYLKSWEFSHPSS